MLTEISQSEKAKNHMPYDFIHMWDIKLKLMGTDKSLVVTREKGMGNWWRWRGPNE